MWAWRGPCHAGCALGVAKGTLAHSRWSLACRLCRRFRLLLCKISVSDPVQHTLRGATTPTQTILHPFRYVEDRFPQLLMHCTKVTGALLSEERLFREYLVPFRRRPPPSSTSASAAPATQPAVPVAATPRASAAASAPETDGSSGERSAPPSPMPSVGSKSAAVPGPTTPPPPQALLSPTPRAAGTPGSSLGDGVWAGGSAGEGAVGAAGTLSPAVTANGSAGGRGSARGREAFSSGGQGSSISPVRRSAGTTPRNGRKTYEGGDGGADGAVGSAAASAGGGLPVRVTEQSGARGENALQDVLVWNESGMAKSMGCRCGLMCGKEGRQAHRRLSCRSVCLLRVFFGASI